MTTDSERWERVQWTREFLQSLASEYGTTFYPDHMRGEVTPQVQRWALSLLKHYPEDWWVEKMRKGENKETTP